MFLLFKPSRDRIEAFLRRQARREVTYPEVGGTAGPTPPGYNLEHTRVRIGTGEAAYLAGREALQRWQQFRLSWVQIVPADTPIEIGRHIALLARSLFGIWSLNACRIVYVVDEEGPPARFGFAYGTLPDHVGTGEERFLVEWDRTDDSVWFDIYAFSRAHGLLSKLFYRYFRHKQAQFKRDSAAAMQELVGRLAESYARQARSGGG